MTERAPTPRTVDLGVLATEDGGLSRHELTRYLVGELDDGRRAEIARRIEEEPALRALVDELRAEDAAFAAAMPFARFEADHVRRRAAQKSGLSQALARFFGGSLRAPVFGLAAAAAALVVVVGMPRDDGALVDEGVRLKGGAHIGVFVQDEAGAHLATDGEALAEGDRVQFVVRDAPEAKSRVIVGIDGRGAVTVYHARDLAETTTKGDARAVVVDESIILDDALGAERFFVVLAPLPSAAVVPAVEAAARALVEQGAPLSDTTRLPLDERFGAQSSVHIVKVARGAPRGE